MSLEAYFVKMKPLNFLSHPINVSPRGPLNENDWFVFHVFPRSLHMLM